MPSGLYFRRGRKSIPQDALNEVADLIKQTVPGIKQVRSYNTTEHDNGPPLLWVQITDKDGFESLKQIQSAEGIVQDKLGLEPK